MGHDQSQQRHVHQGSVGALGSDTRGSNGDIDSLSWLGSGILTMILLIQSFQHFL
jgi:hypothetical protein